MQDSLTLSIVVPTYNRSEYLQETLDSLLHQTLSGDFEIIVVDQNEPGFLNRQLSQEVLDRIILHPQSKPNVSLARNNGFLASRGNLILFIDDDLVALPDFLNQALMTFEEYPQMEALAPVVRTPDDETEMVQKQVLSKITKNLWQIHDTISAAFFIRRDVYLSVGGFDPDLFDLVGSTEDKEFFTRLNDRGHKLYLDVTLQIQHREAQEGGCELRLSDYWVNRERFIRGWVYIERKRNKGRQLTPGAWWRLMRSSFLNRKVLFGSWRDIAKNIRLLFEARRFIDQQFQMRPFPDGNHIKA